MLNIHVSLVSFLLTSCLERTRSFGAFNQVKPGVPPERVALWEVVRGLPKPGAGVTVTPTAFVQGEEIGGKRSPPAQVSHPVFGSRRSLGMWESRLLEGIYDPWAGDSVTSPPERLFFRGRLHISLEGRPEVPGDNPYWML